MIDAAFDELGAGAGWWPDSTRYAASWQLLERLGLRREAHHVSSEFVTGEWSDELVYAVLDHEWRGVERRVT